MKIGSVKISDETNCVFIPRVVGKYYTTIAAIVYLTLIILHNGISFDKKKKLTAK